MPAPRRQFSAAQAVPLTTRCPEGDLGEQGGSFAEWPHSLPQEDQLQYQQLEIQVSLARPTLSPIITLIALVGVPVAVPQLGHGPVDVLMCASAPPMPRGT